MKTKVAESEHCKQTTHLLSFRLLKNETAHRDYTNLTLFVLLFVYSSNSFVFKPVLKYKYLAQ